jgi:hypothetical protein
MPMSSRPNPPPKHLTDSHRSLVHTHARLMARLVLAPDDPRIDDLTRVLAHRALEYGRIDPRSEK